MDTSSTASPRTTRTESTPSPHRLTVPFIPHTEADVRAMLKSIGAPSIDALFDEIEPALKTPHFDGIDAGVDEMTMIQQMAERARRDEAGPCFTGAGCYDHHIPAAVWDIAARGEFMTAYTPYQAEASQGTLQLIYEYQTMITALTGMDVSNASVYDGGSALGEAVLMAVRANRTHPSHRTGGSRGVVVAGACHPHYVDTVANITRNQGIELVHTGTRDGRVDLDALAGMASERPPVAVIVQQPNFFGLIEPVDEIADWAGANGALVVAVVNPTSLAVLKPPGEWGTNAADIACGDGQPLGIPMASGGPSFGFLCTRLSLVRQLPGRLVGRTVDRHDQPGFTLTLQAREQHIRRGKARSNICTNQGLLVTAATIYLAIVGATGLSRVASQCHERTRELVRTLTAVDGVRSRFTGPFFHEHVIDVGQPADRVADAVAELGIIGGLPLGRYFPDLRNCLLVCATEKRTDADIAGFGDALQRVLLG